MCRYSSRRIEEVTSTLTKSWRVAQHTRIYGLGINSDGASNVVGFRWLGKSELGLLNRGGQDRAREVGGPLAASSWYEQLDSKFTSFIKAKLNKFF